MIGRNSFFRCIVIFKKKQFSLNTRIAASCHALIQINSKIISNKKIPNTIININFPVWSKFNTPKDVVGYWKPDVLEQQIKIGDVTINNNDYVMADIGGVVIIPQDNIINILEKLEPADYWFHCASLGEFEQGRPIIEAIKKQTPNKKILLSFFSPSGL